MNMEFSAEDMFGEETQPKTLYVGNLNAQMTDEFLLVLFSQIGAVKGCKIIQEIIFLFGWAIPCISGGVFWNGKSPLLRLRTRPTRHYSPTAYHHPHNRLYKPTMVRLRQPSQKPLIMQTYRPVNYGGMILNSPAHQRIRYHRGQHPFMHAANGGGGHIQHHPSTPPIPIPRLPDYHPTTFPSPISNLVESPGMKVESGTNQHGYLSPTYSGWKPISKPYFTPIQNHGPYSDGRNYISSTEPYLRSSTTTRKEIVMMDPLFRDNVKHIKPLSGVKLKSEYSENQGVTVPRPLDLPERETFRFPQTLLAERPTQSPFQQENFQISTSQTVEKTPPVREKGFPKFQNRPKQTQVPNDSNSGSEVSTDSPQLLSKFKISRPKLKVKSHASFQQSNEPEIEGLGQEAPPKVTFSANNGNGGNIPLQNQQNQNPHSHSHHSHHHHNQQQQQQHQQHQGQPSSNPNPKVHKLRPRVKVKERKPEGFVNADQLSHVLSYRPPGQTPGSQRETKGNSDSRPGQLPAHAQTHHHPSPSYLGNETYDVTPFRPPSSSSSSSFPHSDFPPSPFSTDFMNGFGSDERHHQTPPPPPPRTHVPRRQPITVPTQTFPGGQVIGGGSKKQESVVERPFQGTSSGDGERGLRIRKKPKQNYNYQDRKTTTTTTEVPPSVQFNNNNQNPVYPEEFYRPPVGFTRNPSGGGGGHNPVSFMTMPNSQPQVIHHAHTPHQDPPRHSHQHHLYPINFQRSTPQPYNYNNNYNGNNNGDHQSLLGTNPNNHPYSPNNNNNKPSFHFMNIQNGQSQGPAGPAGQELFGPQHYEGLASSTPFSHRPFNQQQGHGHDQFQMNHPQQGPGTAMDLNLPPPPPPSYSQFPERTTTPRNVYNRFPISSPPLESYGYQAGLEPQNGQGQSNFNVQDPNVNLQAYASNEYERIPLEFMNDLRPILLEEAHHHHPHIPIPTSSSARPVAGGKGLSRQEQNYYYNHQQNSYPSSTTRLVQQNPGRHDTSLQQQRQDQNSFPRTQEQNGLYAPGSMEHQLPFQSSEATYSAAGSSGFMNDFFRAHPSPFSTSVEDPSQGGSTKLYLIPHNSYEESTEKGQGGGGGDGFENYKSAASNLKPQVMKHKLEPSPTPKSIIHPPMIISSPLHDYSLVVTTVSPVHEIDLSRSHSSSPKWSKLKVGGGGRKVISSTENYDGDMTSKYKKLVNKDDTKPPLGREIKPSSSPLSPPPPSPSSSSSSTKNFEDEKVPEESYSHPTPLVLKNMTLQDPSEDDSSDSNTPKSARVRGSSGVGGNGIQQTNFRRLPPSRPSPVTITTMTTVTPTNATTSTTTTTQQFRRRRPAVTAILSKRKLPPKTPKEEKEEDGDSHRVVTTHHPGRRLSPTNKNPTIGSIGQEDGGTAGFESSRLSLKSHRGKGEKSPSRLDLSTGELLERKATTPSPGDPNAVTYGESQWFQIKESPTGKSAELDYYPDHHHHHHHHHHGEEKGSTKDDDALPQPNLEKKEGGKISFSSRILSKMPHVKLEQFPGLGSDGVKKSRNL